MIARLKVLIGSAVCAAALMSSSAPAQDHVVNFEDAEIQAVIEDVSSVTGYTFIIDPSVRGRVSITSQSALSAEEYFQVFLSTMRVHGYTVVPTSSGAFQVVPDNLGARNTSPVTDDLRGDRYVTTVVRLDHVGVRDAIDVLRPMVGASGFVNGMESASSVVMVDYAENVRRMLQVINDLDRDTSVFEMVELNNVSAGEMARIIQTVRTSNASGDDDRTFNVTVAPIPASNTVLLRGNPDAVRDMITLVRRVDAVSQSNQNFRVVALSHTNGSDMLPILEQVVESFTAEDSTGRRPTVSYHGPTNSLVINADPDVQRELEIVIRQLDVRRPQVLVEGIIVEISDGMAEDLGVQFLLTGGDSGDAPLVMTRYSNTSPDLLALTGALAFDNTSSNSDGTTTSSDNTLRDAALTSLLGFEGAALGFGGEDSDGRLFGVILNAVESDTESNVLATPSIVAMDNQEASFLSGQEIPITTGETLSSDNNNPFRTIDREEVGVKLTVTPQINDGDTIRLDIFQEVSSVLGAVTTGSTDLITSKRSITTTVLADNGEIIVLGGLIQQDDQTTIQGIPGLMNMPGVGRLFRSEGESSTRTNLMVFIRPTIIRSEADMAALTNRRYDYISGQQRAASTDGSSSLEDIVRVLMDDTPLSAAEDE